MYTRVGLQRCVRTSDSELPITSEETVAPKVLHICVAPIHG